MQRRLFLSPTALTAAVAGWLTFACNLPFWRRVLEVHGLTGPADLVFLGGVGLLAFLLINLLLTLLSFRRWVRPWLAVTLVVSAGAAYFIARYGVLVDKTMVRNVLETDAREARELLTWELVAYVGLMGILPAWLMLRHVQIMALPPRRELLQKVGVLLATLAGIALVAATSYQAQASMLRNHREVRYLLVPVNYMTSLARFAASRARPDLPYESTGSDAHKGSHWAVAPRRPVAAVIVVGETARASNFSLGGYARDTNPRLAAEPGVVYYPHVTACGTSTAVSLPCMFSDLGRGNYEPARAEARDNLLDVLRRAGLEVVWLDNNSGCKGVCRHVEERRPDRQPDPELCNQAGCFDDILLRDLRSTLDAATSDIVVVLHQRGSHGPGYHLRYPAGFERFRPVCREIEFQKCSNEEVVNAYDNSLLYTDHFVARAIDLMREYATSRDTALLYVSDHGESLGEQGLYLHGLPYAIAPEGQKSVPMLAWLSPQLAAQFGVDQACLQRQRSASLSHDNLFHSVLGLLDVETHARDARLDLFSVCHRRVAAAPRVFDAVS